MHKINSYKGTHMGNSLSYLDLLLFHIIRFCGNLFKMTGKTCSDVLQLFSNGLNNVLIYPSCVHNEGVVI